MSQMEERINEFEARYANKLRDWGAYISADDLDNLIAFIQQLDTDSQAITRDMPLLASAAEKIRWQELLSRINCLVPSLVARLKQMGVEARSNMGMLGKGQRGLMGYRRNNPVQQSFFERKG